MGMEHDTVDGQHPVPTTTGSLVTEAQLSYQVIQAQAVVSGKWLAHRQDIPVV